MTPISRAPTLTLLAALAAQGCGDVPSLGATHCDYTLAECSETFVGGLEPDAFAVFDVRATRKVAPSARAPLEACSSPFSCAASARTLPGPDGDVWVAYAYPEREDADSQGPWLVRIGPDGTERERVLRGPALLGKDTDIVFDDGAGGVALLSAGEPPTLHVKTVGAELRSQALDGLKRPGASYTAPALFPDGSLRMRELQPGEAPTSLVIVAVDPEGALRWRQRYAPEQLEPQTSTFGLPALPTDPDYTPRRGFVFEGERYALIAPLAVSWYPSQAVISFDAQGKFAGGVTGVQTDGESLKVAASSARLAYARDDIADTGGGLSTASLDVAELSSEGNSLGHLAGGRRVDYYDSAADALALDAEGAVYTVSSVGPYRQPAPVICKVSADGADAECSELVLCDGELDTLVWPYVAPAEYKPLLDGTAIALARDQLALHISYVCADADTAAALRELTWLDFLVASATPEGMAPPEQFADVPYLNDTSVLAEGRYAPHDELVFVDLGAALP
jgi:hypothetical protein